MPGLQREGELERGVRLRRRHVVRLLQEFDGALAVAGIARHDAEEHVDAIVGRARLLAIDEQPLDLGRRPRLLAEQALRLVDVAGGLGDGGDRDQASRNGDGEQAADPDRQPPHRSAAKRIATTICLPPHAR